LAVVVYESLSAKLPFVVKSAIEILDRHLYATPIPLYLATPELKVCTETARVLNKALEKDPDKRHQTIEHFGSELHEALMRDSLKLRAMKHRVEVATLQGTMNDAGHAIKPSLDPTKLKDMAEVLDGNQFLSKQADIELEVQRQTGAHSHLPTATGVAEAATTNGEEAEPEYCPYCNEPIHTNLRFCLNCQRKVGTPKDRITGTPLPKPKRTTEQGHGKVSAKSKQMDDKVMRYNIIQNLVRVVLMFAIAYALYAGLTTGVIVDQVKKLAYSLHLPVLEYP
jgi:hypothetical protein